MANYMFQEKLTSNYTLINVPLKENINGPIIWLITCSPKNNVQSHANPASPVPPIALPLPYHYLLLYHFYTDNA